MKISADDADERRWGGRPTSQGSFPALRHVRRSPPRRTKADLCGGFGIPGLVLDLLGERERLADIKVIDGRSIAAQLRTAE